MINARRPRLHATLREGRRDWYKISNNASGSADVYLFDEVGFWGTSAQQFVDELKAITAPSINLHVNSPGGEVFDGLAIYNTLKAHPAQVHAQVHGLAASAASFIIQAADRITVARNAVLMIHDAAGLAIGDSRVMRELADLLDKLSDNCADIYAQRAGGTVAEWRERMLAETWYTGAEAVAAGLADEMTDPDPAPDDAPAGMRNSWDLSVFRYAGRAAAPAPEVRGLAPADTAPVSGPAVEPPPAPATGGIVAGLAPVGEGGCTLVVPTVTSGAAGGIRIEVNGGPGDIAAAVRSYIVGERGPELVDLSASAEVLDETTATDPAFVAAAEEAARARHATDEDQAAAPACVVRGSTADAHASPHTGNPVCRDAVACIERDQPADDWAATVAALTDPDPWADVAAGLFKDPAPSTEDDAFARLREALTCSES